LKTLHELMEKYQWLRRLVGHRAGLPIPKERQQVYARRIRRRRASHIPRLPPFRQELEASCFAAVTLGTLADDILLTCRHSSVHWRLRKWPTPGCWLMIVGV
jgi:hypothetical protein